VPIQVVRRERSGVITTRGGRLLTSASEQKQQDVKMGIELGSGLGSQRQRRGGNHSPTPEMRGGSLRTSIGGSEGDDEEVERECGDAKPGAKG